MNSTGKTIERAFYPDRERYYYDFKQCRGWAQYDTDQDAPYFGVWVNPKTRQVLTYAEGDETMVTCHTEEGFHAELASMGEYYGSPPPAFKTISADGTITEHYDRRQE